MKFNPRRWGDHLFTPQERLALIFVLGLGFTGLLVQEIREFFAPEVSAAWPAPLRIRINSATAEELAALPGIGPVTARRIVEYRKSEGSFLTLGDLDRVKGMTPRITARLDRLLRFD